MERIIDVIVGIFAATLPVFYLLMRRRRRSVAESSGETVQNESPAAAADGTAAEAALDVIPDVIHAAAVPRPVAGSGRSASPRAAETPRAEHRGSSPTATPRVARRYDTWQRINRLSPGRRAIVLAEIVSKPLALRDPSGRVG